MQEQILFSKVEPQSLINEIVDRVTANVLDAMQSNASIEGKTQVGIFDDYIPKTEVRGVLASNSTLWKWENEGRLKVYAIGGRRYYKRDDINALFTEVKKKGASK